MNNFFVVICLFFCSPLFSQIPTGTDIFLSDIKIRKMSINVDAPVNITHREGYDNQPHFSEDGSFIFYVAVKQDKQSDIYYYSIPQKTSIRVTNTPESEYSPIVTADEKYISMVRVEKDSSQRFKKYSFENFTTSPVCTEIDSIGYYNWMVDSAFVFFKVTQPPTLWLSDSKSCSEKFIASKVGRCIYPKTTNEIYFTQLHDSVRWISSMNLKTMVAKKIIACLRGSEDFTVYDSDNFIMGAGSKLYKFNSKKDKDWIEIADFQKQGINNIKRITISKDKTKIAFVNDSGNP